MTRDEHINQSRELANGWFKNHRTTIRFQSPEIIILEWKRPEYGDYAVRYLIYRNYVVVTGDLGDAIYGFGGEMTLEKLSAFDWHYFSGKCCASETGRNYTQKVPGIKAPVINTRAIAHHLGLMMAIEQLTKPKTCEPPKFCVCFKQGNGQHRYFKWPKGERPDSYDMWDQGYGNAWDFKSRQAAQAFVDQKIKDGWNASGPFLGNCSPPFVTTEDLE